LETLDIIYVIKILLGVVTAILCFILGVNNIIAAIGICLLVYFSADWVLRQVFIEKVEKLTTVTKTGVGIYVITFLLVWILIYTLQIWVTKGI
jgi:ABC-type uncharacterized transport system permease subunit